MITHEIYECSVCHKIYNSEEDAQACEKYDSTCPCKRQRRYRFARRVMGYGEVANICIDFKDKVIAGVYPTGVDRVESVREEAGRIKYCPFCGREL